MEEKTPEYVEQVYLVLASTAVEISAMLKSTLKKEMVASQEMILAEIVLYLLFQIDLYAAAIVDEKSRMSMLTYVSSRVSADIGYNTSQLSQLFSKLQQFRLNQYASVYQNIMHGDKDKQEEGLRMALPKVFCGNISYVITNAKFSEQPLPISGDSTNEAKVFTLYIDYIVPIEIHFHQQLLERLNHPGV